MGQRTKGKMWCRRCGPVLGVKNTHKVRNAGAVLGSVVVPGAFLFGKSETYYCPKCGDKVTPAWRSAGAPNLPAQAGDPAPAVMTTPDGQWISVDGGEHYIRTANLPPPPAPPAPPAPPPAPLP